MIESSPVLKTDLQVWGITSACIIQRRRPLRTAKIICPKCLLAKLGEQVAPRLIGLWLEGLEKVGSDFRVACATALPPPGGGVASRDAGATSRPDQPHKSIQEQGVPLFMA